MDSEDTREGLVIISALYGNLPPSNLDSIRVLTPEGIQELAQSIKAQFKFLKSSKMPMSARKDFIDVTIAVQSLVTNSQLHISGGHSKSNLIGFYDPCYGEKKHLRIIYQFQGRLHEVTVGDKQPVAAPLRGIFLLM
jgi:DnaJ family protein C protein 11